MTSSPVTVQIARPHEMETLIEWLCLPEIYEKAFWLAARPDPAWIKRSMLMVENNLGIEFQPVRIWSICLDEGELIGVAIDFGWDSSDDSAREVDFAIPRSDRTSPRLPVWTLASIMHRLFSEHDATEVWGRLRPGASERGFPRLFSLIGGEPKKIVTDEHPTTGVRARRAYYCATKKSFYASRFGRALEDDPG